LIAQRSSIFKDSNATWRAVRGIFPELPSLFTAFQDSAIEQANNISKALPGCKWQNLPIAERKILHDFLSQNRIVIKKADKNMGPVVASSEIYRAALSATLRDNVGTYQELTGVTTGEILTNMATDFNAVIAPFRGIRGFSGLFHTFKKWHDNCLAQPCLCPLYLLFKTHKEGFRPIVPNCKYFTCQISKWLHCILGPFVFGNRLVLKDSRTLVRTIEAMPVTPGLRVATFDVVALYPSINIERGLISLRWFLNTFCFCYDQSVRDLIMVLARFVLTHSFISCPEISVHPFLQLIGTAMGTPFAVVYANIHMFFIETSIVNSFPDYVRQYSRFLDDGLTFWDGSDEDFAVFSTAFNAVDPSIQYIWSDCSKSAVTLDLSIQISHDKIHFEVYHKPGNAFAYLPLGSFHARRTFPAFINTELQRALTHSSDYNRWAKRCTLFYTKLRNCGYGDFFLTSVFSKVSWGDRSKTLYAPPPPQRPFDRRCVWSCSNAFGLRDLFAACDLNLTSMESTLARDLFPAKLSKVVKGAKRLSAYTKNDIRK
jgi:hypothetical protein